jgi:hypothetical protein
MTAEYLIMKESDAMSILIETEAGKGCVMGFLTHKFRNRIVKECT